MSDEPAEYDSEDELTEENSSRVVMITWGVLYSILSRLNDLEEHEESHCATIAELYYKVVGEEIAEDVEKFLEEQVEGESSEQDEDH